MFSLVQPVSPSTAGICHVYTILLQYILAHTRGKRGGMGEGGKWLFWGVRRAKGVINFNSFPLKKKIATQLQLCRANSLLLTGIFTPKIGFKPIQVQLNKIKNTHIMVTY